MSRKTTRPYRAWAPQVSLLRYLVRTGHSARQIAERLDRAEGSVSLKCRELGLQLHGKPGRPERHK